MNSVEKKYFYWIDIAKAISIFGVIYIHIEGTGSAYFRYGVPIFITTSFFIAERSSLFQNNINPLHFLRKRIFRLLIPYLFWSTLYFLIYLEDSYSPAYQIISKHWIGFGWSGQYYLILLGFLTISYPALRKNKISQATVWSSALLTFFLIYLPANYLYVVPAILKFGALPFIYWIFYVFLGIFLARNFDKIKLELASFATKRKLVTVLIAFTIPLILNLEELFLSELNIGANPYIRLSTLLVSSAMVFIFVGFESCFNLAKMKGVSFVSKYTLGIFCIHPLVIEFLKATNLLTSTDSIAASILLGALILALSLIFSVAIDCIGLKPLVR